MTLEDLVRLRRARDRMDREYAEPLDVPALARAALMSPGHFSRSFRAAYGETPYSYLMTRRIERAKALLRRGDLSVTEVCFAVGCTSLGLVQLPVHRAGRREPERVPRPRPRGRRRHPGVRRQDPHATGQEWRSEARCPAPSVNAWTSRSRTCFIAVDDHDKALAFYRDVLGLEVRNDVGVRGHALGDRRLAVAARRGDRPRTARSRTRTPRAADREAMAELLAKGLLRGVIFRTDDCDATFERIRAAGAEVLQEPIDQPYGVRDCAFRDPSGNMLRFNQPSGQ